MSKLVKMVKFNNGQQYPILGLGTWQTTHYIKESDQIEIFEAIKNAIDIGYRHFDCAAYYNNEKSIGNAIAQKIKEGVIKKKEIFITSKYYLFYNKNEINSLIDTSKCLYSYQIFLSSNWNGSAVCRLWEHLWNNKHNPKDVEVALRHSLKELGLDCLDLYLMHFPFATNEVLNAKDSEGRLLGSDISYLETWKAMEQCVQLGLTKSIGISNFNIKQVKDILKIATIKPVVNQVENHPYLVQNKLKEVCVNNGILLTAYGPLGSPYYGSEELVLLDDCIVNQLADKYKKTNAQILIKFQIQRGIIVIPKSTNRERQKENFDVWDFELCKEDIDLLETLNRNLRYVLYPEAGHLKDYPFVEE